MFCPRCGTSNPDTNETCNICGQGLAAAAQLMKQKALPGGVKVGGHSNRPLAPGQRPIAATVLGVAVPGQGNRTPPSPAGAPPRKNHTMLGVAAPAPGSVAPAAAAPGSVAPAAAAPGSVAPANPPTSAPPAASARGVAVPSVHAPTRPPGQPASPPKVPITTPDRATASPRLLLAHLVRSQGAALADPSAPLESALMAEYSSTVELLVRAQRSGVVQELLAPPPPGGWSERIDQLTSRLIMSQRMKAEEARYVVETWVLALGLADVPRG